MASPAPTAADAGYGRPGRRSMPLRPRRRPRGCPTTTARCLAPLFPGGVTGARPAVGLLIYVVLQGRRNGGHGESDRGRAVAIFRGPESAISKADAGLLQRRSGHGLREST